VYRGTNTVASEPTSGHSHTRHVFLIQFIGIGMQPSLQSMTPSRGTKEIHLVAKKVDDNKGN